MKKKIILIVSLLIVIIFSFVIYSNRYRFSKIEDDYLVKFDGGGTEIRFSTYLYIENDTYTYIHESSHTETWGSPNWISTITKIGELKNPEEIFVKAEENNSNGFITLNVDLPEKSLHKGDIITADELRSILANY